MNLYRFASVMKCSLPSSPRYFLCSITSFPIVNVCASGTFVGPFYAHSPFKTICKLFVRWAGVSPWNECESRSLANIPNISVGSFRLSQFFNAQVNDDCNAVQELFAKVVLFYCTCWHDSATARWLEWSSRCVRCARWWPQHSDTMRIYRFRTNDEVYEEINNKLLESWYYFHHTKCDGFNWFRCLRAHCVHFTYCVPANVAHRKCWKKNR